MALAALSWVARVLGPRRLFRLWRARRAYLDIVPGHYAARAIAALLDVGFLDDLRSRGVVDVEAFAASHALDRDVLRALTDYLAAIGVLDAGGGNCTLRAGGHALLDTMQGAVNLTRAFEDPLHCLLPLLRRQMSCGTDVRRDARFVARASGAGGRLFSHPLLVDLIARRGFTRILDLACGNGAFLVSLCQALPAATAYGIDLSPEAVSDGRRTIREARLEQRIELFTGDIVEADDVAPRLPGIECVTSLYGFEQFLMLGRPTICELLWRWRARFPQATVIVCELLQRPPRDLRRRRGGMAELQLGQALTGQRFATDDEWMQTWQAAGFRRIERRRLDFAHTAIYVLDW
jgi:SAM-dependent methyltransferase